MLFIVEISENPWNRANMNAKYALYLLYYVPPEAHTTCKGNKRRENTPHLNTEGIIKALYQKWYARTTKLPLHTTFHQFARTLILVPT